MKRTIIILNFIVIVMLAAAARAYPQTDPFRVAPGAEAQLATLLNKPAMVSHPIATPLGRNWFTLEADAHVFTEGVSVRQVAEVFLDVENQVKIFDGKRSKLTAKHVSGQGNEQVVDFVSIAMVIGLQLRTPYRASVNIETLTDTKCILNIRQTPHDSETNGRVKRLVAPRYIEEVTIDGRKYTYIRIYSKMDVDASILPGAKGVLERNAGPANEEALTLVIAAARTR